VALLARYIPSSDPYAVPARLVDIRHSVWVGGFNDTSRRVTRPRILLIVLVCPVPFKVLECTTSVMKRPKYGLLSLEKKVKSSVVEQDLLL
jgi:hypothetical protein